MDSAVGGNTAKAMDTLKSAYQTEGDTDIDTIISLASMFDMYEQMDKYITVTETENGGYSLKMNIKSEDMLNILKNISNISDSDYNQLKMILSLMFPQTAKRMQQNQQVTQI